MMCGLPVAGESLERSSIWIQLNSLFAIFDLLFDLTIFAADIYKMDLFPPVYHLDDACVGDSLAWEPPLWV